MGQSALVIFLSAALWAVLRGTYEAYKRWADRRMLQPAAVRNAGFITDSKVRAFHLVLWALIWASVLSIVCHTVWLIGGLRGWWSWIPPWI